MVNDMDGSGKCACVQYKDILHEKRKITENHIKQLQQEGKQGVRYTAMMSDIPFLVFGLFSDIAAARRAAVELADFGETFLVKPISTGAYVG